MVEQEKAFKLWTDTRINAQLQTALDNLLRVRPNPSGIKYNIYALEDTAVNAFTFGGRIYITRGMLRQTGNSKALLYAIIGHEIGHSEEGHIKKTIQGLQLTTNIFGEANAGMVMQVTKLLTASFNQRNELEADYYGIELTHRLGQQVCSAVAFWREMASKENRYSQVEDFFRTHPFSSLRAKCLQDHISANFSTSCGGVDERKLIPEVMEQE
jgi:predicted Zn-dependent protease